MKKVKISQSKKLIIGCLLGLRPLLGDAQCRFPTGCTSFAVKQLKNQSLLKAFYLITKRLLICSPFHFLFSTKAYISVL
ncbi:membrane protein insertion efficiency factor YidD [Candidatus Dependentiae bacterium]|nr:membrane protein insertion efficiency factor YidD [Candidatus Dependentiae bacterium]